MNIRSTILAAFFLSACFTQAFAHHTAVIVNKGNSVNNLSSAQLSRIVRGDMKQWPDGKPVLLVLHKQSLGEAETLKHLNRMTPEDWRSFAASHKDVIVFVDSDSEVLKAVQAEPGAVGLIDVRSVDGTINIVHIDGKLPMEAGYLPH